MKVRLRYKPAYWLAMMWTLAWGALRQANGAGYYVAWSWERRESPEPAVCERCGWAGPRRWAVHGNRDECPKCVGEV